MNLTEFISPRGKVLKIIEEMQEEKITLSKIAKKAGMKYPSCVQRHIKFLKENGYIDKKYRIMDKN